MDRETLYRLAVLYGVPIEVIVLEELDAEDWSAVNPYIYEDYIDEGGEA